MFYKEVLVKGNVSNFKLAYIQKYPRHRMRIDQTRIDPDEDGPDTD